MKLIIIINSQLLAFGCSSMGAEVLEEELMEPFVESLSDIDFSGKKVVLFGSYDWGDGEGIDDCKGLGEQLAKS